MANEFHFLEGEKHILPDTHEWIDITTYEQEARGEKHYLEGKQKHSVEEERTYTLAEIKAAFWREFHLCGELWFGYLGSDEDNEDYTQSEWEDFERELEK